jgi:hypothetical protein
VYVTKLSISNLRSIESAEIGFCHPGSDDPPAIPNVTLLLGDNGVGKTSVLRAIALAILSPVIASSGFSPYNLVRRTSKGIAERADLSAHIVLHAQDLEHAAAKEPVGVDVETVIERRHDLESVLPNKRPDDVWEGMFIEQSAAFLMVGYSAGRRVEAEAFDAGARKKSRRVRFQRVAGLFEEGVTLTPLGAWLPRYQSENPGRHKQVINLMNCLLPEGTLILEEMERDEYVFEHNGARVPFAALSDGYRAYIGWIADLLYHICMGAPTGQKLVDNRGIVLVDEIDLHLHPAWQREVVPQLARALPNLQFVLTTHSPIVAGTLQAKNIRLIAPDETGASSISLLDERIHGLNADQILVSSYFGLDTTRAPDAVDELRALSQEARHGGLDAVREFMQKLAGSSESWDSEEPPAESKSTNAAAPPPSGRGGSVKHVELGGGSRVRVLGISRAPASGKRFTSSSRTESAGSGHGGGGSKKSSDAAAKSHRASTKSSGTVAKSDSVSTKSSGAVAKGRSASTKSSGTVAKVRNASTNGSGAVGKGHSASPKSSSTSTKSSGKTATAGGATKKSIGTGGREGAKSTKTSGGSTSGGTVKKSSGGGGKGGTPKGGGRGA